MLSSAEFKEFGKGVVLFAHVTTRIEGRKNDGLLGEKGGRGFPYLVALNAAGDVTATAGNRSVEGFQKMMESGAKYDAVLQKAEKTTDDNLFLLTHEISLGKVNHEQAKERVAAMGDLDTTQKKKVDGVMLGFEIQAAMPRRGDQEGAKATGKKFAEWWAAGKAPEGDDNAVGSFFSLIILHAETSKDVDLFERALGKIKDHFGERAQRFVDGKQKVLDALKAEGTGGEGE